jgi:hypothetical protein
MDSKVELALISTGNSFTQGFLDLYGNEPINIKMSIANISDISQRTAPYTQTFVVPGTKNNNELLGQIFNIGSDSSFDPRQKTPAYLAVDSIPVMQNGIFQLNSISVDDNKKIDYNVTIFSDTHDLYDTIGDKYIADLDFSDLNHVYSYSSIINSWTGSTPNKYYYPLIDAGFDFNISQMNSGLGVQLSQMLPSTQVKTIWDKIFSGAGLTYNSTFLSGSYFSNLYIPFNSSNVLTNGTGFTNQRSFLANSNLNTATTINISSGLGVYGNVNLYNTPFPNDTVFPNFNGSQGLYNDTIYIYSSDTISSQQFNILLDYEFICTSGVTLMGTLGRPFIKWYRSSFNSGYI